MNKGNNKVMAFNISTDPAHFTSNAQKKIEICNLFSRWVKEDSFSNWHYSLYSFTTNKPLNFFANEVVDQCLAFFNANRDWAIEGIIEKSTAISIAFNSLTKQSQVWDKNDEIKLFKPNDFIELETIWNPEYVRYTESIFNNLIEPVMFVLGKIRSKNYSDCTLATKIERLNGLNYDFMTKGVNTTVRNSIGHGSYKFYLDKIVYEDKKTVIPLDPDQFSELFDNLVETCNSIALALILFVCNNVSAFLDRGVETIPFTLKHLAIEGFTCTKDFQLTGMVESQGVGSDSQLNISCRTSFRSVFLQLIEITYLCWSTILFVGKQYTKLFISIDCGSKVDSICRVDSIEFRKAVKLTGEISGPPDFIEVSLFWTDDPRILRRFSRSINKFRLMCRHFTSNYGQYLRENGFFKCQDIYKVSEEKSVSTSKYRMLKISCYLCNTSSISQDQTVNIMKSIISKSKRRLLRLTNLNGNKGLPWFPDIVTLRMYRRYEPKRRLARHRIINPDFIAIMHWIRKDELIKVNTDGEYRKNR